MTAEHRFLVIGVVLILAVTVIGTALLIHFGSKPHTELWARYSTIEAKPFFGDCALER